MLTFALVLLSLLAVARGLTPAIPEAPEVPPQRVVGHLPDVGRPGLLLGFLLLVSPGWAHAADSTTHIDLLGLVLAWIAANSGWLAPLAFAAAVAIVGGGLHLIASALASLKAGKVRHYSLAILQGAAVAVSYVEQVVKPTLVGPDGKLDEAGAKKARDAAIAAAMTWLKSFGLDALKANLKLTDDELAEKLGVAIEAQVAAMPSVAPAPAPTVEGPRPVIELASGRKLVKPGEPVPAT